LNYARELCYINTKIFSCQLFKCLPAFFCDSIVF